MAESSTTKNQIDAERQSIEFFLELNCSSLLTEELKCSVCLDVFTDPVTIPCGHNFCKRCLNQCWEMSADCLCPVCKETFNKKPDLKINTALRQVIQFLKTFSTKSVQISDKVLCDYCDEQKLKAMKSCLTCQSSYCGTHLERHHIVPQLKKHKLINAVKNLEDYICQKHDRPLELFCRDDQTCVCLSCTDGDHKNHNAVPLEEERVEKKTQVLEIKTYVQKMIQDRMKKIQDIKHSAEFGKVHREKEKAVERYCSKLPESIEQKQKEQIEALEKEIAELKRSDGELEKLSQTEDPLHFLQIYFSQCRLSSEQWPESSDPVSLNTIRTDLAQMQTLDDKVTETELNRMRSHAVDVTLDPDTAHPELILSADGKQVSCGNVKRDVPDNPKRFDRHVFVLGKKGFSSGKFYFEVQVMNKTKWGLGVVRESAMRKGDLLQNPQNGYWAICLRNGKKYLALTHGSVSLSLKVKPQKVGVFVDYQEGLVSFYEVESKSHIYRFTGMNFTEKLYPYLCPSQNEDGKNAEPLIILNVK